jgi:hypothetical protein
MSDHPYKLKQNPQNNGSILHTDPLADLARLVRENDAFSPGAMPGEGGSPAGSSLPAPQDGGGLGLRGSYDLKAGGQGPARQDDPARAPQTRAAEDVPQRDLDAFEAHRWQPLGGEQLREAGTTAGEALPDRNRGDLPPDAGMDDGRQLPADSEDDPWSAYQPGASRQGGAYHGREQDLTEEAYDASLFEDEHAERAGGAMTPTGYETTPEDDFATSRPSQESAAPGAAGASEHVVPLRRPAASAPAGGGSRPLYGAAAGGSVSQRGEADPISQRPVLRRRAASPIGRDRPFDLPIDLADESARPRPAVDEAAPAVPLGRELPPDDLERALQSEMDAVLSDPGYGYGGDPFAEDSGRGGRRRGVMLAGGLVLLLAIGGAGAVAYRTITGPEVVTNPPVLRAQTEPVKVVPEDPGGAEVPNQDALIFDRVGGAPIEENTRLVTREEPVLELPAEKLEDRAPVSEAPASVEAILARPADPDAAPIPAPSAPRRVRTLIVNADGSILPPEEETVAEAPAPAGTPATATGPDLAALPQEQTAIPAGEALPAGQAAPVEDVLPVEDTVPVEEIDTSTFAVPLPLPRPGSGAGEVVGTMPVQGEPNAAQVTTTVPVVTDAAPEAPAAAAEPNGAEPQVQVATLDVESDAQTAPAPQAEEAPAAASEALPAGTHIVQLLSTRDEEQARASYASLQRRYPAILSDYQPLVQRAELGDRGTFYRVRVGPLSSDDAQALCNRLKGAGMRDCLVARN